MSELLETLGFACLCAFAYYLWPPAAFIPAAIYFILAGLAVENVDLRANLTRKRAGNEPD